MVIDTSNNINNTASSNRSRGSASSAATDQKAVTNTAEASNSTKENVVLSQEAQRLNRLQATISELPDVNIERVAALKQAISEGKFEINPERIAENMLKQDDLLN
jgi:negative regulator of flagellin synthesis FlgM